jgi:hypothetical protein
MSTRFIQGGEKMKLGQIGILFMGVLALMAGAATVDTVSAGTELVSMLVDKVGVTEKQAEGGAGALFKDAKQSLSPDDFQKVSDAVPEMDKYLEAAPETKESGGALGKLSSMGGGLGKVGSLGGLTDSFSQLGMDSGTLTKFVPVVLEYVQSTGGDSVSGLLKGLWQ